MIDKIKDFVKNVLDIMRKPEMLTLPSTLAKKKKKKTQQKKKKQQKKTTTNN